MKGLQDELAIWAAALGLVAAGVLVRIPLSPWLHGQAPYLTVFPAITLAAVLWGGRVGIVAGLVGFLAADLLFVEPLLRWWPTPTSLLSLVAIVGTAACLGYVGDRLRKARDGGRTAAAALCAGDERLRLVGGRRQTEEALRRRAEEVERLLEIVPAAVWVASDRYCVSIVGNRRANELYEAAEGDNVSAAALPAARRFFTLDGRELAASELPMQVAAARNQEVREVELYVQLPSGRRIAMLGSAIPLRNEGGEVRGCIGAFLDITTRKQAEETLRRSEAKLRAVFRALAEGVLFLNTQGEVEETNEAVERLHGHSLQDLAETQRDLLWRIIRPDGTLFPVDEQPAIVALRTGEAVRDVEMGVPLPDGQISWRLVNAQPAYDDHGRLLGVVASFFDITARKQAEESLRESEELLRLHVENTPLAVIEWGPDFRLARWSAEAERIFGWHAAEVLGKHMDEFRWVHEEDAARVAVVAASLVDGSHPRSVSRNRNYRRNGSVVHCEWYNSSLRDESGKLRSILSLVLDVTEHTAAEERQRLLSEVTACLLASDQPQQIVEALCRKVMAHLDCQTFINYLVDEPADRLHLNAWAGIPPEAAGEIEWLDFGAAVCGCAARDGRRIVVEEIQITPDPLTDLVRSFGIQAYACHPLLNQGRVIGTLSFGSRTKPRFADDELALMKVVADHVALAMQRVRLLESRNMQARAAEAASEAKSQFLANMSHELRTPMNAILGMIDVALTRAADATLQDCLQTARESADLLLTLLNDLLDSAKIESGRLELEAAPFSLRRMLDQTTRALAVRAREKGLGFYCRIPADTPDGVVGDRMRLQQVLLNLAGNAIKFTERGEVEIGLRAASVDGHAHLEFAVRDTGIGIPPSGLERLFQPFFQADASMARRFGGTGLGLAISKSLVEMMGGTISVESELGRGSTFSFAVQLPLASALPPDVETAEISLAAAPSPLRVLLVEDNPANQKLATYILRDRGHLVEIAGDGQEAIFLTQQHRYDVILMDVQMPGMNGLEATAAIRQGETSNRGVPIIAITAHAMQGDRDRCLSAGMDGYLFKPVKAHEMIALVESLGRGGGPPPPAMAAVSAPVETSPDPAAPVFDAEEALKRCFHSTEMVRDMIRCFFDEVEQIFPQMRQALEQNDLVEVGRLGHRLKGTALYLAAEPVKHAALRVEQFCLREGGTRADAAQAVLALERECLRLQSALTTHPLPTAAGRED